MFEGRSGNKLLPLQCNVLTLVYQFLYCLYFVCCCWTLVFGFAWNAAPMEWIVIRRQRFVFHASAAVVTKLSAKTRDWETPSLFIIACRANGAFAANLPMHCFFWMGSNWKLVSFKQKVNFSSVVMLEVKWRYFNWWKFPLLRNDYDGCGVVIEPKKALSIVGAPAAEKGLIAAIQHIIFRFSTFCQSVCKLFPPDFPLSNPAAFVGMIWRKGHVFLYDINGP